MKKRDITPRGFDGKMFDVTYKNHQFRLTTYGSHNAVFENVEEESVFGYVKVNSFKRVILKSFVYSFES